MTSIAAVFSPFFVSNTPHLLQSPIVTSTKKKKSPCVNLFQLQKKHYYVLQQKKPLSKKLYGRIGIRSKSSFDKRSPLITFISVQHTIYIYMFELYTYISSFEHYTYSHSTIIGMNSLFFLFLLFFSNNLKSANFLKRVTEVGGRRHC